MSWLNLNQSFSSLKGQITNFASEVLSEVPEQGAEDNASKPETTTSDLEEKCRKQELEIAAYKKLTEELEAALQAERLSKRNGVKDEDPNWYWDPPPQQKVDQKSDEHYRIQIRALQDEISTLKERDTIDLRPDAEEEIHRLREENRNLTSNLEDLDNQHQLAMERLLSLKKELQMNFEVLKQEYEDLKNSNDEYADEIKTLMTKIGERDKELESLQTVKSDYDTLHHKYQNLERMYGLLRENAEKFQEENQELHEDVFKLQEQVSKLEHDVKMASKNIDMSDTVPKEKYNQLEKELNELKSIKNTDQIELDEVNIDDNAKSVIENLKRDINDLRYKLSEKETNTDTENNIKTDKIMQLYNKYINFEIPTDFVGNMPSVGEDSEYYKLESVFKTVNSFKKDIDKLEHTVSEKNHTINHLQAQIDDLATENEFLTTDLQHFEAELNEMKQNNDFLLEELAALKNTSKLEPIIETHEDNLAKLENELADSNKLNKTFESQIQKIEMELAEVKKEKNFLQESLHDLKSKYTTLLSELDLFKNKTAEVEELEAQVKNQAEGTLNNATKEIDELKKKLNAANSKNEQLSIDVHIIENDKVLLTKQVDELKNALEEKASGYKELENLKLALDHKLQDFESKLDEVIKNKTEVENQKVILEEKVGQLERQISTTESNSVNVENITMQNSDLSESLEKLTKENATLKEAAKFFKAKVAYLQEKEQKNSSNDNVKKITVVTKNSTTDIQTAPSDESTTKSQNETNKTLAILKEENNKLKSELSATDTKILHLEQEFEKLLADIEEKDAVIDELNNAVHENKVIIFNLNKTVSDLEQTVTDKNEELERLRLRTESLSSQLVNVRERFNQSQEELHITRHNYEDANHELSILRESMSLENSKLAELNDIIKTLEKAKDEYKTIFDEKDKEINELHSMLQETQEKYNATFNQPVETYFKIVKEKEIMQNLIDELKNVVAQKEKDYESVKRRVDELEQYYAEYKLVIEKSNTEKSELINLINLKHNESIQYHNEIQRLNQILVEQANEFKKIAESKDHLSKTPSDNCSNCETLKVTLNEKDEIIKALNQNASEFERLKLELANSGEVVKNLTEKCDNLDKSLTLQLETVKKLTAENAQLSEQEQNSARELERLRHHLVETEESYTQELMTSEQKLTECQARLHQVEERAKQTSTVYTSNSIRANQEVETLRNQIKLLEKQREEVQAKLSEADDARSRSEAALTNLQIVLEQFQLDKEREVHSATEKIRNKMEDLKRENRAQQEEISKLNAKLEESLAGLQAASRLGDQLESKTAQINDLREQVKALQTSVSAAEERYYNAISNQQDKVDKNLVKNLLINYVMTAANTSNKIQVLRILSTVLDFNQQECEKLGLVRTATPDSLAAEFVKFLQNESKPRPLPTLPSMMGITQSRSNTPSRKSSTAGPSPLLEPSHKRNPSNGSNNLLFTNIENVETSSQLSSHSRTSLDTGVNQTRNNEGAILKHVLRDM